MSEGSARDGPGRRRSRRQGTHGHRPAQPQPLPTLLYQVATATLSPADVAEPIRKTLGHHRSIRVLLAEVTGVADRTVRLADVRSIAFGKLVIATGSQRRDLRLRALAADGTARIVSPGPRTFGPASQFRKETLVSDQWISRYVTRQHGVWLIDDPDGTEQDRE